MLYCVLKLCTVISTQRWAVLIVVWIGFCLTGPISLCIDSLCLCLCFFVLSCHTAYVLYYCNTVGWTWWDWSLSLRTFLQCFDTVGCDIWSVKTRPLCDLWCVWWDVKPYSTSTEKISSAILWSLSLSLLWPPWFCHMMHLWLSFLTLPSLDAVFEFSCLTYLVGSGIQFQLVCVVDMMSFHW